MLQVSISKNNIERSDHLTAFVGNELLYCSMPYKIELLNQQQVHKVNGLQQSREDAAIDAYARVFTETGDQDKAKAAYFETYKNFSVIKSKPHAKTI